MSDQIEKVLQEKGRIVNAPFGNSMLPLIRPGKDVVVLKRVQELPEKYDVVLYRRANGKYILHRILDVKEEGYILCGDGQYVKEYKVHREQILGVMEGFYRNKTYVDVKSKGYRLYTRLWCMSLGVRKILLLSAALERRALAKLKAWKESN